MATPKHKAPLKSGGHFFADFPFLRYRFIFQKVYVRCRNLIFRLVDFPAFAMEMSELFALFKELLNRPFFFEIQMTFLFFRTLYFAYFVTMAVNLVAVQSNFFEIFRVSHFKPT